MEQKRQVLSMGGEKQERVREWGPHRTAPGLEGFCRLTASAWSQQVYLPPLGGAHELSAAPLPGGGPAAGPRRSTSASLPAPCVPGGLSADGTVTRSTQL